MFVSQPKPVANAPVPMAPDLKSLEKAYNKSRLLIKAERKEIVVSPKAEHIRLVPGKKRDSVDSQP